MWGRRNKKKNQEREGNGDDSYKENMTDNAKKTAKKADKVKYKKIIFVTMIIVLGIVIIACPAIVPVIFTFKDVESAIKATEASLLATGIAIIGVAITAWTGLNIANAVNKKDLEKLQDGIKEQSDNLDELKKDTKKQSDEMNIKMTGMQNNYYSFFLQELLKTQLDAGSLYLYEKFDDFFRDKKSNIVKIPLLMEIEQNFAEVYSLHNNANEPDELLISKANKGLEKIQEYESKEQAEGLVKKYLNYRKGEFNYYKGYREKSTEEAYNILSDAAEAFFDFAKIFGIQFEFNEDEYDIIPDYTGDSVEMLCYLAGSIGGTYSQIAFICDKRDVFLTKRGLVKKEDIITCAKKAIYFCRCAVKWSEDMPCENEVHFRNLGAAYERFDRINETPFKHKKEIMENYKYAFQMMHNDSSMFEERIQKIYHTTLSYYEKYFKEEFSKFNGECLKYTSAERESVLNNAEELLEYRGEIIKMIAEIKAQDNNVIDAELLHEYVTIARSGVDHNPHYTLRISLLGLAYTYVIFLLKADDASAKQKFLKPMEYYITEIEKLISYLDIVDMTDDYANELRLRYKGIMGL